MPTIDSGRQRARLTHEHLDVVTHLLHGQPVPAGRADAERELTDAGLLRSGAPVEFLAELVAQLTQAEISIDVEISGRDGVSTHGALLTSTLCWTVQGWPGTEEKEYALLDPRLLPTWLAATLGLSTEGSSESEPEVDSTVGALDAALATRGALEARLDAGGSLLDGAAETLGAIGETPGIPPRLAELLTFERRAWRVTCSWRQGDQLAVRAVAVVDAGPQGLWQRALPAEPVGPEPLPPTTALRFRRLSPSETFRAVGELVPRSTER
ncbi:hypothetical protein C8046_07895 [Serinibacter arcticus]|uniref:Uncharacterized protein n=1 Tax=Serinibacter arcticus TaxID=1655435 RepID=A0A2U1ZUC3_9MICO|nr:hypothetical protein [Serinibacter arcticus]PWD50584.1 hypothetical protein C8046_07895 [Serinibacter arcticus]